MGMMVHAMKKREALSIACNLLSCQYVEVALDLCKVMYVAVDSVALASSLTFDFHPNVAPRSQTLVLNSDLFPEPREL